MNVLPSRRTSGLPLQESATEAAFSARIEFPKLSPVTSTDAVSWAEGAAPGHIWPSLLATRRYESDEAAQQKLIELRIL